ncbi:MAG: hypothetical protein ACR2QA_19160 [Solirubrobacteraceae bacterium]
MITTTYHSRSGSTLPGGQIVIVKELKTHRVDTELYRRFRDEVKFHLDDPLLTNNERFGDNPIGLSTSSSPIAGLRLRSADLGL